MQQKLQELTEKLYNEGLSKGKEEGEKILAGARTRAEETIAAAKAEAAAIVAAAEKEAEDLKAKAESDIRTAAAQSLQATRKDIEDLLVNAICADKVNEALSDPDFIRKTISEVASRFSASEGTDIALMLPSSLQEELEPWVAGELSKVIGHGVKAGFSKKIAGGFTIGPGDGSWFISLSDETFKELIAAYLRPVTRRLIFG